MGYILVITGCMILLFLYSRPFMLYTALMLVITAVIMYVFLRKGAGTVDIKMEIPPAVQEGQEVSLSLDVYSGSSLLTAGYILAEIVIKNEMFQTEERRKLQMSPAGRGDHFEVLVSADLCGTTSIECEQLWIFDFFKLFRVSGQKPKSVRTVVYPQNIDVQMEMNRNMAGAPQDEGMIQNRRGNDPSEIFDIREYVPGDDIRSIHWKLSSKTDTLILKEASDPSHYNAVLIPDFGREQLGKTAVSEEFNTAVGIGAAVGQQFIEKGIPFCIAFPTEKGLQLTEIRSRSGYQKMLTQWLGLRIQENSGGGLKCFMMEHMEKYFTRLLILSAGSYDQNLGALDGKIGVTVLNASKDRKSVHASRNGTCQIVEIPSEDKKDTYRIIC